MVAAVSGKTPRRSAHGPAVIVVGALAAVIVVGLGLALLVVLTGLPSTGSDDGCGSQPDAGASIVLGPPGTGQLVGATEYGGPDDPSSGTIGASGANLLEHPDSYAELGGVSFQTATAMGGLAYMTPLRITWGGHSAIAYKRDFGLGGGPVAGLPRIIDLWWQLAGGLGVPYDDGRWSGPVRVGRPAQAGAGNLLGLGEPAGPVHDPAACAPASLAGVPVTPGDRAQLLSDGLAAAPAGAPPAVREMLAAGNQIAGRPYVFGAGHGVALSAVAPAYDCSSSVEHLLYAAGLVAVTDGAPSASLESFGLPGPGRWVTLYANQEHVFMYVAGLRWDTHDAAGAADGSAGIGWHPLVRSADGFIARHPVGL
jgi:hypothetical protein